MVTYWESSKRPLYLKTIWRDGQHHVVLEKEDVMLQQRPPSSARSILSRKAKSAIAALPITNLNVPSIKLFLGDSKDCVSTKDNKSRSKRCKTGPSWKTLLSSRNNNEKDKNLNLYIKSNSVDVSEGRVTENFSHYLTYTNYMEHCNNTLSERVLVWLDLATQNGNQIKQLKIESQRLPVISHPNNQFVKVPLKRRCLSNHQINETSFFVEGITTTAMSTKTALPDAEKVVLNITAESLQEEILVTSEIEQNIVIEKMEEDSDDNSKGTMIKRQLHIFMPDLPKKYSDCDSSILSSQISGSSLRYPVNSRKVSK